MLSALLPSANLFNLLTFACAFSPSASLILSVSPTAPTGLCCIGKPITQTFCFAIQSFNGKNAKTERVVQIHWRPVDLLTYCKYHPRGWQCGEGTSKCALGGPFNAISFGEKRAGKWQIAFQSAFGSFLCWNLLFIFFLCFYYFCYLLLLFILLYGYLNSANIFIYSFYYTSSLLQALWHIFCKSFLLLLQLFTVAICLTFFVYLHAGSRYIDYNEFHVFSLKKVHLN